MSLQVGDWIVYAIIPIDHGWDDLQPVDIACVPRDARDAARALGWEGDLRREREDGRPCCVRFFVPYETNFYEGFVWKHDNNGTCFVACTINLPHLAAVEV